MKISQAEYEAHRRYNEKNYEQISIRVPIGEKKKFKQFAQIAGVSLATYIRQSCYEKSYRQKEGITMQKPQQNKLPEVDLTTQIIDFNDCPVNKRVYGGLSGAKIGVVYKGADYLIKFPQSEKEKQHKNVVLSYSNSPTCEYIGSHIYQMLGISVHETLLGKRSGKIVVACKDFRNHGDELQEFRELKTTFEPPFVDSLGNATDGQGLDIDEILQTINEHPRLKDKPEIKERFWDMFIIDAIIGNADRNNGNWGIILRYDQTEELAPVYDNGSCLNPRWDEEKMRKYLDNSNLMQTQAYKGVICIYTQSGKKINPYQYLSKTTDEVCLKEIKKIYTKLEEQQVNINQFIKNIPTLSDTQKSYYKTMINTRISLGLRPIYKKSLQRQTQQ